MEFYSIFSRRKYPIYTHLLQKQSPKNQVLNYGFKLQSLLYLSKKMTQEGKGE